MLLILLIACVDPALFAASEIVDAPGEMDAAFRDSSAAINGVRGGGPGAGSTDVFSLGYDEGVDNYIVLGWDGRRIVDGPGTDLVVFENPFETDDGVFMDPVIVELSEDGVTWQPLVHDYTAPDERSYSDDPNHWLGFAGVTPVLLHADVNPVDPFDRLAAGGDHFDFAHSDLQAARFVRLVTAPSRINPDTGDYYPRDSISDGADIDGVYARYFEEE